MNKKNTEKNKIFKSWQGKILIATPYSMRNTIFAKSIIYIISHSKEGARGIMLNQLITYVNSKEYFKILSTIAKTEDQIIPIYLGGPDGHDRGKMLHSNDSLADDYQDLINNFSISSDKMFFEILINGREIPSKKKFIQGYTGWPSQILEEELKAGLWVPIDNCPLEIIFDQHSNISWENALNKVGINPLYYISSNIIT
jgi:putative transcriptional regulator